MKNQRTFSVDTFRINDQISEGMIGIKNRGTSQNNLLILRSYAGIRLSQRLKIQSWLCSRRVCIILVNLSYDLDGPFSTNPKNYDRAYRACTRKTYESTNWVGLSDLPPLVDRQSLSQALIFRFGYINEIVPFFELYNKNFFWKFIFSFNWIRS